MILLHSNRLKGLDTYAYLKDLPTRLPAEPAARIKEPLPCNWRPDIVA